ncbi:hypothetical protein PISL3812_00952 [Talaromyces islandicus]|uniref:Uncharacterized protein n=1 Tax=Talaromyces islandicus TaxID=28573 RepID=A0A0U1LKR6_TALIS|nr:hypothetical protein PISL3812_00952 [Talaromyces islandicus]
MYINIAYRVAGRLNMSRTEAFEIYCVDTTLDRFYVKPLEAMQQILEPLRPQVALYQTILKSYQYSPNFVFHIQSAIAAFIKMDGIAVFTRTSIEMGTPLRMRLRNYVRHGIQSKIGGYQNYQDTPVPSYGDIAKTGSRVIDTLKN